MRIKPPIRLKSTLRNEKGAQTIEFGLVFLPLLGVLFLIMDISWLVFAQGCLQWAVQQGVRYAVTSTTLAGKGQDDSVKTVVQVNSMGFLAGTTGLSKISIAYYTPSNLSAPITGTGSNSGGNIVKVSVNGVTFNALGPVFRGGPTSLLLSASSSDVMESSPGGIAPTR